jgi:hypothetical protein
MSRRCTCCLQRRQSPVAAAVIRSAAMSWSVVVIAVMFIVRSSAADSTQSSPIVYDVTEKQVAGTIVGNLASDIGVGASSSSRLLLLNSSNVNQQLFRLDSSGLLRTASVINRDVICTGRASCTVPLDVAIMPASSSSTGLRVAKVQVNIVDLNDCVPTFQRSSVGGPIVYHISESTPPGVLFGLPVATDSDSPANGVVGYRLSPTSDTFGINQTVVSTGDGDVAPVFDVRLVLLKPLSRQRQGSYVFDLIAYDGGTPLLSGSIQVQIVVDAASDPSSPRFDNATYRVSVDDNAPAGATVVRIHATSSSAGASGVSATTGAVSYAFSSRSRTVYGHLFAISSTTGDVTLMSGGGRALSDSIYNLSVEATDAASPNSVPGIAALIVTVRHINDDPPTIVVESMTDSGRPEVLAGSPPGTFVAFLTVTDEDQGPNGEVACAMFGSDDGVAFVLNRIFDSYYKLITTRTLYGGDYQLTVMCSDSGEPPLSVYVDINVTVTKPFVPVFKQTTYVADVVAGGSGGNFVIVVSASNSVSANSTKIIYSLDNSDVFSIDRDSGVMSTSVAFPVSAVARTYDVHVTAGNAYNLTAVAVVRVTIISESQVTYLDRAVTCSVSPAAAAGQLICTLGNNDARLSTGNAVYYAVVNTATMSNGSHVLQIDSLNRRRSSDQRLRRQVKRR